MRQIYLPFSPPAISDEDIRAVVEVMESKWITTGQKTQQFECEFSDKFECEGALALSSCTAALHTGLVATGIRAGDEVVTTPMTFAASVNVIEHIGAKPVFVDIEPDTMNMNADVIESVMTDKTTAVLPVHFAGHPVDMDTVLAVAEAHRCVVLEDAAHAVAAKYKGRPIGAGSNPTAFSFYATKNLTTAEGGMLTASLEIIERAREISLHGMTKNAWKRYDRFGNWQYDIVRPGYKYNMTDIEAAIGLAQLNKLPNFQCRRRNIVAKYQSAFGHHDALETPVERPDVTHAWHLYVLRIRPEALTIDRDIFVEELAKRNIATSVHFIPVHTFSYYAKKYAYTPRDFPVAYNNFTKMFSLPLHPYLQDTDVDDVIDAVLEICRVYRR